MATLSLNVGNFITLRLTPNNYPLWREQALALAESQELVGHLTNEDPAPNKYVILHSKQLLDAISWTRQTFTLTGRGFQAQQSNDSRQAYNSSPSRAQRRPPPPGERRMTPSEGRNIVISNVNTVE
ncbi:hypothetical protein Pint_22441 [Pistacia integerrima]|uniref:Uncharacterized protein n=1 Tax=Pistacia integerrima TaxID=434235 RepID=A0ACC0YG64_9ROSI|nr:hypothetical protein Pint_22441 [Pistacia integerrima]